MPVGWKSAITLGLCQPVQIGEGLSGKECGEVQHFDRDTGVHENALARQKRLELEKEKRPSIHEQLAEKKAAVRAKDAAYTDVPKKSRIAEASL